MKEQQRPSWSWTPRATSSTASLRPSEKPHEHDTRQSRPAGSVGLRRIPGSQGPRSQVRAPVPGADLRRRVPARALLRQHRREGDRRGLQIVEKQLRDRTVRTGEEELFKARAKEGGSIKLIDIVKARLDAKNDCYLAELPSLALRDVRIDDQLVRDNERMLTDGFYAEVTLSYDGIIGQEQGGRPFKIESLRPIQMSKSDVLDVLARRARPSRRRSGSTS
jgi:hypothetical protein